MKKRIYLLLVTLLFLLLPGRVSAQFFSLRTNLVGLATSNLNLEASMAFSLKWSGHLPVQYNPFKLWDDAKVKNLTIVPGVRYWVNQTYSAGYFFGLHGVFSLYNAGGLFGHTYRYEGTAWGGGISFGWARPLSKRWNFELELGGGVVWADWERYMCPTCGRRVDKGTGARIVPTRTAVNLVYLF